METVMALDKGVGVREADLPWVDIGVRPGYNQRYQGFFDKARGIGARLGSLYAQPYYHSPRHRHTFQQMRYVMSGSMRYGDNQVYVPGDCLFLPEGTYYGPVKPVKSDDGQQLHFVDMQFMGPSGIPYPAPDEIVSAQRELKGTGTFEEGVYTFADGHKRDAYEAILEHVIGTPLEYPPKRLCEPSVMRTPAYPDLPHGTLAGVSQKHLGFFFDSGPNFKLFTLESGAVIPAGKPTGHRALFLIAGDIKFDRADFDALSYFVFPHDTEHAAIEARSDATILALGWAPTGTVLPFELF
jgi:hypothetical protein